MSQTSNHSVAKEMYILEHTRWKDHVLLFLGIIASAMLAQQYVKDTVPTYFVFAFSAFVSFLWLCAVLANRSTSFAWSETLKEIENSPATEPFRCFRDKREQFSLWRDIGSHFYLVEANGEIERRVHVVDSVTRVYITLSLAMMCTFTWLAFTAANSNKPELEARLGRQLIERDIRCFSPEAKMIELFAPTTLNPQYQAHILLQGEKHRVVLWDVDSVGRILKGPYSP
jgi:hypothetical protein